MTSFSHILSLSQPEVTAPPQSQVGALFATKGRRRKFQNPNSSLFFFPCTHISSKLTAVGFHWLRLPRRYGKIGSATVSTENTSVDGGVGTWLHVFDIDAPVKTNK